MDGASLRQLKIGILVLAGIVVAGTIGYIVDGWNLVDSVYMVVITIFGVGYGEVHPLKSTPEKIFTILLIVSGTSAIIYVVGGFVRMIAEGEIRRVIGRRRRQKEIEVMEQHVIVCGYGRIGRIIATELQEAGTPFLIVDKDEGRVEQAQERGFIGMVGDAAQEECLEAAGIQRAAALTTVLPQDAMNVFITLTARNLNPTVRIIARGEQPATEKKLLQAGADEVVLPAMISGLRIANSITKPSVEEFLEDQEAELNHELGYLGMRIRETKAASESGLVGKTIAEIEAAADCEHRLVVAVRRPDGTVLKDRGSDYRVAQDDVVVAIAHAE